MFRLFTKNFDGDENKAKAYVLGVLEEYEKIIEKIDACQNKQTAEVFRKKVRSTLDKPPKAEAESQSYQHFVQDMDSEMFRDSELKLAENICTFIKLVTEQNNLPTCPLY